MAESSEGSSSSSAGMGSGKAVETFFSSGILRALPSPTKAIDLDEFLKKFKMPEYELREKPKEMYGRTCPLEANYKVPSYGRNAIDLYSNDTKTNLRPYKSLSLYKSTTVYNRGISEFPRISYKQAEKYGLN